MRVPIGQPRYSKVGQGSALHGKRISCDLDRIGYLIAIKCRRVTNARARRRCTLLVSVARESLAACGEEPRGAPGSPGEAQRRASTRRLAPIGANTPAPPHAQHTPTPLVRPLASSLDPVELGDLPRLLPRVSRTQPKHIRRAMAVALLEQGYKEAWLVDAVEANDTDRVVHLLCLLYTSPSPRDMRRSRMPSSA